ncbi:MAG: hypothetical protein ACR2QC_04810 [Gammaproteobacteria bacterium]
MKVVSAGVLYTRASASCAFAAVVPRIAANSTARTRKTRKINESRGGGGGQ